MLQKRELTGLAKRFWDVAQYICEHGWSHGQMSDGDAVCIAGAFWRSRVGDPVEFSYEESTLFSATFARQVGVIASEWNDASGRTKEEVIDKLEEIAWKLADEQDQGIDAAGAAMSAVDRSR